MSIVSLICIHSQTSDVLFLDFIVMALDVREQAHGSVASQLHSSEEDRAFDMTTSEKVTHWAIATY